MFVCDRLLLRIIMLMHVIQIRKFIFIRLNIHITRLGTLSCGSFNIQLPPRTRNVINAHTSPLINCTMSLFTFLNENTWLDFQSFPIDDSYRFRSCRFITFFFVENIIINIICAESFRYCFIIELQPFLT